MHELGPACNRALSFRACLEVRCADTGIFSSTFTMAFSIIPRSLFGLIPLQVGAQLVAAVVVLNKVSALYGLGALFTGHGLTPMQWITNVMSAAVLPLVVMGYFSILSRRPLRTLAYTHFYVLDTAVSLGFTIYFIVYWFTDAGKAANNPPQEETPARLFIRQHVQGGKVENGHGQDLDKSMTVGQELAATIVYTTIFLLIRMYFMMVLIGYARMLVRKTNLRPLNGQPTGSWGAKIQYVLLVPLEGFWTGTKIRRGRSRSFGPAETERLEPN